MLEYLEVGTINIRDSIVSSNTATNGDGGGVNSVLGNILAYNSTFDGNTAGGFGGGLNNVDVLIDSTVSNNRSGGFGGGLSTFNAGIIFNTTISGNESDSSGGGINVAGRPDQPFRVAIANSTISGNQAEDNGGGLNIGGTVISGGVTQNVAGDVYASNVTITNNIADSDNDGVGDGGGVLITPTFTLEDIRVFSGQLTLMNSILAGNFDNSPEGQGNINPDIFGAARGNANNLLGSDNGRIIDDGIASEADSIGAGSDLVNVDPRLGPLQDNGGATLTHALLTDSPARDAGNNDNILRETFIDVNGDGVLSNIELDNNPDTTNAQLPYDQRLGEFSRIVGGTVDIGAFELQEGENPNPPDQLPIVANPIADITVEEDAENQTIDLSNIFQDADGDEITIEVQSNSNEGLVATTIENNSLTLDFAENQSGTAEIILRATANGETVDDTFTVTVNPVDDPGDNLPTVANPIADITVEEDAENQTIDLSNIFQDADGDEITIAVQSNSNEGLVATTIENNSLTLDFAENQSGTAEIILRATANGETVDDTFTVTVESDGQGANQNNTIELFRFRNTTFDTGTYIFVGERERDDILANPDLNQTFELDGVNPDGSINPAFTASTEPGEGLEAFYRLSSLDNPGTFLFAGQGEYDAIFAPDSDQRDRWERQGFDSDGTTDIPEFYLFGVGAGMGTPFNRFQNRTNNTFLFAGPGETEAINSNPDLSAAFLDQGGAFEAF